MYGVEDRKERAPYCCKASALTTAPILLFDYLHFRVIPEIHFEFHAMCSLVYKFAFFLCQYQAEIRKLMRQLEKDKVELQGQLRDLEWRLDNESKVCCDSLW